MRFYIMELFGFDIDVTKIIAILLKLILRVVAFAIIIPVGKKLIGKSIEKASRAKKASPTRMKTVEKLLQNIFSYVMIFIFIVMFVSKLGVEIGPLLAGAGVVGLAVAFGAQGLVSDIVTGFFIILEQQLEIDDYVTTAGYDGVVEEIGLRTTKIRSFDGTLNYIPNRYIESVANHTRGNMQALVDIGISYGDNIDKAIAILDEVCASFKSDERLKEGPDAIGVQSIAYSEVVLRVLAQTENGLQWACERDLRKAIKQAFDENGITLPENQIFVKAEE